MPAERSILDRDRRQGVLDAAHAKAQRIIKGRSVEGCTSHRRNRGHLPAHLPRIERIIEPQSRLCPCGCSAMARIGEDVSEQLDAVPAQLRVLVTRRPKYACRRRLRTVVQAHAPEHVVAGGLPTEELLAQFIIAKFGDHLPFYRLAEIYARQGIRLDRATLDNRVNWAGRACFRLKPIAERMRQHLAAAYRLFMDDTTAPVLDPWRGEVRKGKPNASFKASAGLAPVLRQAGAQYQVADRQGGDTSDRGSLCHRGNGSQRVAAAAACRPAGAFRADRRRPKTGRGAYREAEMLGRLFDDETKQRAQRQ